VGKSISETAAHFAKPLGTLVTDMRQVLGQGDSVGAQKFLEQFTNHWQNILITGKFLKNVEAK
jgi:hypothetical protein